MLMEEEIKHLEESVKSCLWENVCEIILKLEKVKPEIIPVGILENIIEHGGGRAPTHAMRILSNLALKNEKAKESFFKYLMSSNDGLRCLAYMSMKTFFSEEDCTKLPANLLLKLIEDPIPGIRRSILDILLNIAKKTPDKIPLPILYKAIVKEKDSSIRDQILKIAETINPPSLPGKTIKIDTLYLINWIKSETDIKSTEIHELIGDICAKYISGGQEFHLIRSIITESCVVDAFLFLTSKRYRGHEIHQFNVGSLGLFLLKIYVSNSETLEEYIRKLKGWESCEDVEKCWLIAAFLHDHAIPIEYIFRVAPVISYYEKAFPTYCGAYKYFCKALDEAYHNLISGSLFDAYEGILQGRSDLSMLEDIVLRELNSINFNYNIEKDQVLDHGILAAVNITTRLRSKNDDFVDRNDIIKTATKAIALHNFSYEIAFKKDPITFLLVLCDEIQEWEREVAAIPYVAPEASYVEIGPFRVDKQKLFFEDDLSITFDFSSTSDETLKVTGWDYKKFKNGKDAVGKKLIFDPAVRPKRIIFKTLA